MPEKAPEKTTEKKPDKLISSVEVAIIESIALPFLYADSIIFNSQFFKLNHSLRSVAVGGLLLLMVITLVSAANRLRHKEDPLDKAKEVREAAFSLMFIYNVLTFLYLVTTIKQLNAANIAALVSVSLLLVTMVFKLIDRYLSREIDRHQDMIEGNLQPKERDEKQAIKSYLEKTKQGVSTIASCASPCLRMSFVLSLYWSRHQKGLANSLVIYLIMAVALLELISMVAPETKQLPWQHNPKQRKEYLQIISGLLYAALTLDRLIEGNMTHTMSTTTTVIYLLVTICLLAYLGRLVPRQRPCNSLIVNDPSNSGIELTRLPDRRPWDYNKGKDPEDDPAENTMAPAAVARTPS